MSGPLGGIFFDLHCTLSSNFLRIFCLQTVNCEVL